MGILFEKSIRVTRVLTTSVDKARALDDPVRAAILDLLSKKPLSVEDMAKELKKMGIDKAPTTIRHHVDVLKDAGLIELVKVEEVKGGVLKYYSSKARFLGYEPPEDFDEKLGDVISDASQRVLEVIKWLGSKHGAKLTEAAEGLKPCPYCSTQHFEEYVLLEVIQRGMAEALQKEEFSVLLKRIALRRRDR